MGPSISKLVIKWFRHGYDALRSSFAFWSTGVVLPRAAKANFSAPPKGAIQGHANETASKKTTGFTGLVVFEEGRNLALNGTKVSKLGGVYADGLVSFNTHGRLGIFRRILQHSSFKHWLPQTTYGRNRI